MSPIQRYGLRNNLIGWVHRHNRMATLFRSTLPGAQRSFSPRNLPSYRSVVQPAAPGASPEAMALESQIMPATVDKPANVTYGQNTYPVETPSSRPVGLSNQPSPSKSSAVREAPQPPDRDWRRLQTIFRKHQEKAGLESSSVPEALPSIAEPQIEQTAQASFHEDEQPEPKHSQQPGAQTVFRKPQLQAQTKSDEGPGIGSSQTDLVPRISPDSSRVERQIKQNPQGQAVPSLQRQPQEPAETESAAISEQTTSQLEQSMPNLPQQKERPNLKQRVWHGLRSIFRQPQESNQEKTAPVEEMTKPSSGQAELDLDQTVSNPDTPANSSAPAEVKQQDQPFEHLTLEHLPNEYPPIQRSMKAVLSSKPAQRSIEGSEPESQFHEPTMSSIQPGISRAVPSEPKAEAAHHQSQIGDHSPEPTPEVFEEEPAADHVPLQLLPLEAVWNVQRIEVNDFDTDSPVVPQDPGKLSDVKSRVATMTAQKDGRAIDIEPTIFPGDQEQGTELDHLETTSLPSSEPLRTPVEILTPSRPRPFGASVMSPNPTVQRQPENGSATVDVKETALVDTAIGPLPADLWSLLGQKPPISTPQPEIHRQASVGSTPPEKVGDQKPFFHPSASASASEERSANVVSLPNAIQRQALPNEAAIESTSQGQDQAAQTQKPSQTEADLNDLAHKVYLEVRRRLAKESERTHRHL